MHIIKESWKRLWNAQEVRTLVLVSMCLQFGLVFLAPLRKRSSKKLLMLLLWLFYLSADYVAILALGNILSQQIEGTTDLLKAFWAPFLLLHLGGPDTITSYSLEDNELWWRHFLGLAVQVFVAFMVLLYLWAVSGLRIAATLVFIVGFVKYGERTWALRSASTNRLSRSMFNKFSKLANFNEPPHELTSSDNVNEVIQITGAYNFFTSSIEIFVDRWELMSGVYDKSAEHYFCKLGASRASKVVEIELSFLYDMLHTKATQIRALRGCLWRFISLGMISIAFILFVLSEKRGYAKDDIIISYVLLGSALFMELISLLLIIISDWMIVALEKHHKKRMIIAALLEDDHQDQPTWKLEVGIASIMLYFSPKGKPRWSNSMGQYSLLRQALGNKRTRRILRTFKVSELWVKFIFVQSVCVPSELKEFLFEKLKSKFVSVIETGDCGGNDVVGEEVHDLLSRNILEFNESILVWHIATDICYYTDHTLASVNENRNADKGAFQRIRHFLNHWSKNDRSKKSDREISLIMSNYMLYLLIVQPSMMSSVSNEIKNESIFLGTYFDARDLFGEDETRGLTAQEARKMLLDRYKDERPSQRRGRGLLRNACILANELKSFTEEERWSIIGKVWTEMLCFAAVNCKVYNHFKQLSQGGELLTHVWLMLMHMRLHEKYLVQSNSKDAFRTLVCGQLVESELEPVPESEPEP